MNPEKDAQVLEQLFPISEPVQAGGESIEVRPLSISQTVAIGKLARGALGAMKTTDDVTVLLIEHGEEIISATAIAIKRQRDWVADLPVDQFVALLTAVLKVNQDFFAQRLAPLVSAALATPSTAAQIGQTPSIN